MPEGPSPDTSSLIPFSSCRPDHPDPFGRVLVQIADAIIAAQTKAPSDRGAGWGSPAAKLPKELAIFYDWVSLCQKDAEGNRSDEESLAFREALNNMQAWISS